jgi:hypothetical protein
MMNNELNILWTAEAAVHAGGTYLASSLCARITTAVEGLIVEAAVVVTGLVVVIN